MTQTDGQRELRLTMWYVVYADRIGLVHTCAERSRDRAIRVACEFLNRSYEVRRVMGPDGSIVERPELDARNAEWKIPDRR
jgi:hypothetical protein